MWVKRIWIYLLLLFLLMTVHQVDAKPASATFSDNRVKIAFPESITFHAQASNDVPINSVMLEYGANELTCGTVIAKAFPKFEPGKNVSVEWTWDMRQSGSLPPGETIWWRWHIVDANGREDVSDQQTAVWIDSIHEWQSKVDNDLILHWYSGDQNYATILLNSASSGLQRLETDAGLTIEAPVDFYIYASTNTMKEAVLYEPSWTGGQAYPTNDIVILGISNENLDWGTDSIVHELTHVLVGHLTFSCLGTVPTWLNEGLAVYSEGDLDPISQQQLDQAIRDDTLMSLRSLSGGFSEVRDKATLSYSESYSVVKYLIERYGHEQMRALLLKLRDGSTIDEALQAVYGFQVEGLEREWRNAIGARPMNVSAQPTAAPTATFVPTIVPLGGAPLAITPTPYAIPTSSFSTTPPAQTSDGTRAVYAVFILGCCCLLVLIAGGIIVGLVIRNHKKKTTQQNGGQ